MAALRCRPAVHPYRPASMQLAPTWLSLLRTHTAAPPPPFGHPTLRRPRGALPAPEYAAVAPPSPRSTSIPLPTHPLHPVYPPTQAGVQHNRLVARNPRARETALRQAAARRRRSRPEICGACSHPGGTHCVPSLHPPPKTRARGGGSGSSGRRPPSARARSAHHDAAPADRRWPGLTTGAPVARQRAAWCEAGSVPREPRWGVPAAPLAGRGEKIRASIRVRTTAAASRLQKEDVRGHFSTFRHLQPRAPEPRSAKPIPTAGGHVPTAVRALAAAETGPGTREPLRRWILEETRRQNSEQDRPERSHKRSAPAQTAAAAKNAMQRSDGVQRERAAAAASGCNAPSGSPQWGAATPLPVSAGRDGAPGRTFCRADTRPSRADTLPPPVRTIRGLSVGPSADWRLLGYSLAGGHGREETQNVGAQARDGSNSRETDGNFGSCGPGAARRTTRRRGAGRARRLIAIRVGVDGPAAARVRGGRAVSGGGGGGGGDCPPRRLAKTRDARSPRSPGRPRQLPAAAQCPEM